MKNSNIQRFHIISGDTFPSKNNHEFDAFFLEQNKNINFIQFEDISNNKYMRERFEMFYFYDFLNEKKEISHKINLLIRKAQCKFKIQRKMEFRYKGLVWASLTRELVQLSILEKNNKQLFNNLKYDSIPEEFYFQYVLEKNDLISTVCTDLHRFAIWPEGYSTGPRVLSTDDMKSYLNNERDYFFVRKVDDSNKERLDFLDYFRSMYRDLNK